MGAQWVEQYLDAWNSRRGSRVAEWVTGDCVYEDVTLAEIHKGTADIASFVDRMSGEFSDDFSFTLVAAASTEDHYWMEWVLRGTHNGAQGPFPATGRPFEIRGASVGSRSEGKISANRDYWDMAAFLAQTGLVQPPG